ncbi:Hsp20/alpha crystallin family protein [Ramlibacter albus]|uniref:Hsp20/alpha crystallin family protein n=1 Tax=Ramlibacter albus TaxID=2079448 RepID=A0A923M6R7_9BURK|nr:Hsp20/alpha crystallin family protein [Ramlibacter albus]MBC5763933.1 Hsp20/alpha crystallin family protein [Ramlibacter albus]
MGNLKLLDPLFGDTFDSAMRRFFAAAPLEGDAPASKMKIDVTENADGYLVKADLPGMKKEDISVRVDGNFVQIDAQSGTEKETRGNGDKLLCRERTWGAVSRAFTLASDIDESMVDARYADGVLTLRLPRKAGNATKKITVN